MFILVSIFFASPFCEPFRQKKWGINSVRKKSRKLSWFSQVNSGNYDAKVKWRKASK